MLPVLALTMAWTITSYVAMAAALTLLSVASPSPEVVRLAAATTPAIPALKQVSLLASWHSSMHLLRFI
jgi:hypothetical protein